MKIGCQESEKLVVKYGVPQGSVLGPLLFLLYINDLNNAISCKENYEIILYADDTNIFVACKSLESAQIAVNEILSEIDRYMSCNLLHINLDKSCFMYFPPNRKFFTANHPCKKTISKSNKLQAKRRIQTTGLSISIASSQIKEVTEAKFLGVWFEPMSTRNVHIKTIRSKLMCSIAIIKRILPFISKSNHKNIYHTLFESHLAYCISAWGGATKYLINSLSVTQKRLIRYIFGDTEAFMDKFCTSARTRPINKQILGYDFYRKESIKPLFYKNKLLTVHNLYKYMCTNEMGKIITTKIPAALSNNIAVSQRNDRNIIILPNNRLANNQFLHASSSYWNVFVKELKIPNPHNTMSSVLKSKLKKYLLNIQNSGDINQWNPSNMEL